MNSGLLVDRPGLRERARVFRDRTHAGQVLAEMLHAYADGDAAVLAIPAGGVPVARSMARALALDLDLLVVSKITLPWTSEAGYGAVASDGTVRLNEALVHRVGLSRAEVDSGIERTRARVERRARELRGSRPIPALAGRPTIAVDDGLASGFTMAVALEAIERLGASRRIVAVPTAHADAVERLRSDADEIYCANVRHGPSFAVADAYNHWYDVSEEEVRALLA